MMFTKTLGLGLLTAALMVVVGCSQPTGKMPPKDKDAAKTGDKKKDHAPHGKGPNGGIVFDFGKYHGEFTVDHDKKECTVVILGDDEKTPTSAVVKELTVITLETKTKESKVVAPMTIKMLPKDEKDGKASKFVGTDPGLGNVADFEGTVVGEIDGKRPVGKFKE